MSSSQCKTCDKIKNPDYSSRSDCSSSASCTDQSFFLNLNPKSVVYVPNKTFSAQKVREIEKDNALLAERISYHDRRPRQYKTTTTGTLRKVSSSEINRRKHQEKIGRENQILLKKIQSVKPSHGY